MNEQAIFGKHNPNFQEDYQKWAEKQISQPKSKEDQKEARPLHPHYSDAVRKTHKATT